MKTLARMLLLLLLAAASTVTLATDRKGDARETRAETSSPGNTAPTATQAPPVKEQKSPETRKLKRCRNQYKTVGIACRTPASR